MVRFRRAVLALAVSLPVSLVATPATVEAAAGTTLGSPAGAPIIGLRHGTSTNWAGYATSGARGSFTSVSATWVQPSVSCTSQDTYSSYWVGLDGNNTSTVEQLGTEADCSGGSPSYYAWFEMYPRPGYYINTVGVKAGDSYTASVTSQGSGKFLLTLTDNTTHRSFSTTQKLGSARLASAEVIVEAPWSGGVLPLADFGTASFSAARANGSALGRSSPDPITMENPYGMVATPSKLQSNGTAFSVTWSAS